MTPKGGIIEIRERGEKLMATVPQIEIRLFEMMAKRDIRTIEELKSKSGLSRKAISTALNNKNHRMHTDTIAKLCTALDCTPGDLLKVTFKEKAGA